MATASLLFAEPLPAGTPLAWGFGEWGQLGDGNFYTDSPYGVATAVRVSGLTSAVAIAGGNRHSLALKPDGTVWAWGYGELGQLGDGNFYKTGNLGVATPVQVSGFTGAVAIAGGQAHSLAIKSDGTIWAWGYGADGQLGLGDFNTVAAPVQVSGLTGALAIACGDFFSLALKSDGTVWAWGAGWSGQLGDGSFHAVASPVQVTGSSSFVAIAAGANYSLGLKSDGTVWAWGGGQYGQLGDGNFHYIATPVQVGELSQVRAIACGSYTSLGLKSDGTVWAWGRGQSGQLGDGNFYTTGNEGVATPVQVSGLRGVVAIASGYENSLALKSDGTVWAWGAGSEGQLGDGNFYPAGVAAPILVSSLGQPVTAIAAGGQHSLALPAVRANTPPPVFTCPSDLYVSNDPGQCSAVVNFPAPGSVFPVGTTRVTCTATDAAGNSASCSFNVTVNDAEPPAAGYAVVKAPTLFTNPPRLVGAFQLLATDNCDPDPLIYIKGNAGSFVAGPFHNGDQVEIAHGPNLIPRQAPSTFGGNIASIQLNGDVLLWAVDSSGNASTPIQCK